MRHLDWTARAAADLTSIVRYYRDLGVALGELLFLWITTAPELLLDQPGLGSATGLRGIRKWRLEATPVLLLYRILKDGMVETLRVHHAAQDGHTE